MTISALLIRVVLLILPGILSWMLFRKLVGRTIRTKWEDLCEIVVFSVVIYSICVVIAKSLARSGWLDYSITFFETVLDETAVIAWYEILMASLVGIPVAFLASYVHTNKLINRFGRFLRVTRKFGDQDVWDFFHNLPDEPEYEWVYVRDHKTNLVYFGCIHAYSDSEKEREMLLGDVDVYTNDKGEFLYNTKMLYLCRARYDLTIEVPITDEESQKENKGKAQETK